MDTGTDEYRFNGERLWRLCVNCARTVYRGPTPPSAVYTGLVARFLMEIAAVESSLRWERQRSPDWAGDIGGFSKWQMEPLWVDNARARLRSDTLLARRVADFVFADPHCPASYLSMMPLECLLTALRFDDNDAPGAALCRVGLFDWPEPVPGTVEERAQAWKSRYNTALGKGTVVGYLTASARYVVPTVALHPMREVVV